MAFVKRELTMHDVAAMARSAECAALYEALRGFEAIDPALLHNSGNASPNQKRYPYYVTASPNSPAQGA